MAVPRIKTTYSLDAETVRALERIARQWKVSKSEVLRRAIRAVASGEMAADDDRLRALDSLQQSLNIDESTSSRWEKSTRDERRASSRRREDG